MAAIYVGFTSSSGNSDAPMHRQARKRRRPLGVDRRLVVMAGGVRQTAVLVAADFGYGMVNSVVGSLVVGLAIGADVCDDLANLDATLQLLLHHQFDNALGDIGFETELNDLVAL